MRLKFAVSLPCKRKLRLQIGFERFRTMYCSRHGAIGADSVVVDNNRQKFVTIKFYEYNMEMLAEKKRVFVTKGRKRNFFKKYYIQIWHYLARII